MQYELCKTDSFLAYMDVDDANTNTKPRWTLLRDISNIVNMFVGHARGDGVYMTEISMVISQASNSVLFLANRRKRNFSGIRCTCMI